MEFAPTYEERRQTPRRPSRDLRRCFLPSKAQSMPFLVNSAPRAGFRFEPGVTFHDVLKALEHAVSLSRRGMRAIQIRDTQSGRIFDERALRAHINEMNAVAKKETSA